MEILWLARRSDVCIYEVAFEAEVIYASIMNTRTRIGIVFR